MAVWWLIVCVLHPSRPVDKHATSPAKASSVPGITHTASRRSSAAEKPRVPVPKSRVTSLSPTFAGRERTLWRCGFNRSAQHLLILRGEEVCDGDVADLVHGSAESRAVGAMEEWAKCCGDLAGAGKEEQDGR